MTDWQIARLAANDYAEVVGLWEAAGLSIRPQGRDSAVAFAVQLAGGTQIVLGVRTNGRLVGVVLATHDGRKGWINRLAVHPECRRQGLALALIAEAERVLTDNGLPIIAALVEDWNEASLALFDRAGYQEYPDVHYVTKRQGPEV
jgi:N-acetylglutamate synthase